MQPRPPTGSRARSSGPGSIPPAGATRASRRAPRPWDRYADVVVIDALASPGPFNVQDRTARPLTPEMVAHALASGITAVNLTVNEGGAGHAAFDATVRELSYWEREIAAHPQAFVKVRTAEDLDEAKAEGRLGLIYGFQDGTMLESDVGRVDLFHDFGVRILQLTYNGRNLLGDGCLEPANGGLSRLGRDVVERMNEVGMLVDLSHCGQRTTADAIEVSSAPVAVTHSGCSAVYGHPRNKRDEELRAMALGGGVLGIYLMPFLNAEGPPRARHVVAHIEHALDVCGEDHVGIGSDQSITPVDAGREYVATIRATVEERRRRGVSAPREDQLPFVEDLNLPRRLERIADLLLSRGHSEARVEKIVGGNWRRLFGDVWKRA